MNLYHYKTWIYSIKVFYNTLKLNHIILCHIWYLQYIKLSFYIYSRILPVLISTCCIELITTRREFTLLKCSTTLSSIFASFCITFDICNKLNCRSIYIPEYSQYWFQHAVLNVITTRREFTLFQYSKTLSSIIASFCIIFDICSMMNLAFYIYSRILPVLISKCFIEFISLQDVNLLY